MTQEEHTELNEAAADTEGNSYSEEHKRRSVMNSWANDIQNLLLTFYFRLHCYLANTHVPALLTGVMAIWTGHHGTLFSAQVRLRFFEKPGIQVATNFLHLVFHVAETWPPQNIDRLFYLSSPILEYYFLILYPLYVCP